MYTFTSKLPKMKSSHFVLTAAVLFTGAHSSFAGDIHSASDPSLAGSVLIDFESSSPGAYGGEFTLANVTFDGFGGPGVVNIDWLHAGAYNTTGERYLSNYFGDTPEVRISFANPVDAFGFNFGASDVSWTLSTYTSSNALIFSYEISPLHSSNDGEFFGMANAGISYAVLTSSAPEYYDWVMIDNFRYKTAGDTGTPKVPDAGGTAPLLLAGLVALVLRRSWSSFARMLPRFLLLSAAAASSASAITIVDTGVADSPTFIRADDSVSGLQAAFEFTLTDTTRITSLQAYMRFETAAPYNIFYLHADGGEVPGALLNTGVYSPVGLGPHWDGPGGLNWVLGAGSYWVHVTGFYPFDIASGAPSPVANEANWYRYAGFITWQANDDLNLSVRVTGERVATAVPDTVSASVMVGLMGFAGLVLCAFRRVV